MTRVALIGNPHAGRAEGRAEAVEHALRQTGAEVIVPSGTGGDLGELARRDVLRVIALAACGRLDHTSEVWRGEFSAVTVDAAASSLLVALDGEVTRLQTPLFYRSRPGALLVIAPAGALSAGC